MEVFHAEGGRVAIVDRDAGQAEQLAGILNTTRAGSAAAFACDVSNSQLLQKVIHEAANQFGRLDCLINNAGIHPPDTPLDKMPVSEAQHVLAVNF